MNTIKQKRLQYETGRLIANNQIDLGRFKGLSSTLNTSFKKGYEMTMRKHLGQDTKSQFDFSDAPHTDKWWGSKVRRFKHVSGFADNTKYVEIHENGEACIIKNDRTKAPVNSSYYTLETCLQFVKEGVWVEV